MELAKMMKERNIDAPNREVKQLLIDDLIRIDLCSSAVSIDYHSRSILALKYLICFWNESPLKILSFR